MHSSGITRHTPQHTHTHTHTETHTCWGPASTQDRSSQLEAGISGRHIINIHRLLFGYKLTGNFSRLKVSLSSLSFSALSLAHLLAAWGCTHSAFSCALCFSPMCFSFLELSCSHTSHISHTHTTCTLHSHTHSLYTPHILSPPSLHMLFSCSLVFLLPQSFIDTPKAGRKKTLYNHCQIKFKRITTSHKESRITIVPQSFKLPYSQAYSQNNNNCKLIII